MTMLGPLEQRLGTEQWVSVLVLVPLGSWKYFAS